MFHSKVSIPQQALNKFNSDVLPYLFAWKVKLSPAKKRKARSHGLPAPLIVSLTSYPARYPTLPLTLKCLLFQSVEPDRFILWIAHEDRAALTPEILDFKKDGLEIRFCEDLKSYKKIIPTLQLELGAFVVIADDDLYYWPTWLEELVDAYEDNSKEVICHRAHHIRVDQEGFPRPYLEWDDEIKRSVASPLNFPTGGAGTLYPPGVFHSDVIRSEIFSELCPHADDIWLFWMMRLSGAKSRKTGSNRLLISWPKTQAESLWRKNLTNTAGGNNGQIQNMIEKYGFPNK